MLSESQQKMVLKMLLKYVHSNDAFISREDVSDLYSTRSSFYRAIMYLVESGLVEKVEIRINVVRYRLTWKGELLARVICGLADMPEQFKEDASLIKALLKWRI